jgi:hypothetical protein
MNLTVHGVTTNIYGTKMGRYGSGMGLLASPTPVLRLGWCWTHLRPITGRQYGIGMRVARSPTRSLGRYPDPRTLSGMGLVLSLSHIFRRYMDGNGYWPIPDGILGSGMPVDPSPTHTDPFLNPRRNGWPHLLASFWTRPGRVLGERARTRGQRITRGHQ